MSKRYIKTFEVAFAGRTELVEFSGLVLEGTDLPRSLWNHDAFACRIGRGAKAYRASVTAWRIEGMHPNTRKAYGGRSTPIVVDDEGNEWGINLANCTVRNRQAHIIGWAEDYAGTTAAAQHDAYSSLRKDAV